MRDMSTSCTLRQVGPLPSLSYPKAPFNSVQAKDPLGERILHIGFDASRSINTAVHETRKE